MHQYNLHMHGNDIADSLLETYASYVRCVKWWFRLFHFLLDLGINNTYLLYRQMIEVSDTSRKSPIEHSEFLITLINELVDYCLGLKSKAHPGVKDREPKKMKMDEGSRLQCGFVHYAVVGILRGILNFLPIHH